MRERKAQAAAMAILAFPLVISFLKPQASRLSFHLYSAPTRFRKPLHTFRRFAGTSVSAITTSAAPQQSSKDSEPRKPSLLTFQQAIQRLQVWLHYIAHIYTYIYKFSLFFYLWFVFKFVSVTILSELLNQFGKWQFF